MYFQRFRNLLTVATVSGWRLLPILFHGQKHHQQRLGVNNEPLFILIFDFHNYWCWANCTVHHAIVSSWFSDIFIQKYSTVRFVMRLYFDYFCCLGPLTYGFFATYVKLLEAFKRTSYKNNNYNNNNNNKKNEKYKQRNKQWFLSYCAKSVILRHR